jgi:hypothetical protein
MPEAAVKGFRLSASYFSLMAPKEKITKRKGAFPIRAQSVGEWLGHFQTRILLDLKTARIHAHRPSGGRND